MDIAEQANKHATRASFVAYLLYLGSLLLFFVLAALGKAWGGAVVLIAGVAAAYFLTPFLYGKVVRFSCPSCGRGSLSMRARFGQPTSYRCNQCAFEHQTNVDNVRGVRDEPIVEELLDAPFDAVVGSFDLFDWD